MEVGIMGCGSSITTIATGGLSALPGIVGDVTGASQAAEGAQAAAMTQAQAAQAGITEQKRQFDAITKMMQPFLEAGTGALTEQQALLGTAGPEAQAQAIQALEASPQYQSLVRSGEEAMLQRAAATGGLRGGNIQGALAQYRPDILSKLIESQYSKLGGLTSLGQASAGQQAGFGQQTSSNIANLLQQQGAAQAGGQLAAGQQQANTFQNLLGIGGIAAGFF